MLMKSSRKAAVFGALAPLGAATALVLEHYRPFGDGQWQDFSVGLLAGGSCAAAIVAILTSVKSRKDG